MNRNNSGFMFLLIFWMIPKYLTRAIIGDKTWCFQCDPKCQSMQWKTKNSSQLKKKKKPAHFGHSSRIYLCVFLVIRDSLQQIINNGTNYQSTLVVLKRLQEYIRKKRPETLAWQVDSLPFQWSCRWWIRFTWVPG